MDNKYTEDQNQNENGILAIHLPETTKIVFPVFHPISVSHNLAFISICGKTVKSRTGGTCKTTWGFDGKEVKKRCGAVSSNTYLWNGRIFRPVTGATGRTTWVWNGTELKKKVGSTSDNTWCFDGHYWTLKQGATGKTSWAVSGFIPIPVCALIILGLNNQ